MFSEILSIISISIAGLALILGLLQNTQSTKSAKAEILASLQELSLEADYTKGEELIVTLPDISTYGEFEKKVPDKADRECIEKFVVFLSHMAHLVEGQLIHRQIIWNKYFLAYRFSNKKLLPWWLEKKRKDSYIQAHAAFERMCKIVALVPQKKMEKFDKKLKRKQKRLEKKAEAGRL